MRSVSCRAATFFRASSKVTGERSRPVPVTSYCSATRQRNSALPQATSRIRPPSGRRRRSMSSLVLVRLIGFMTLWSVWVMPKYFHISMSMGESFPGFPHLGAPALVQQLTIGSTHSATGLRKPAHLAMRPENLSFAIADDAVFACDPSDHSARIIARDPSMRTQTAASSESAVVRTPIPLHPRLNHPSAAVEPSPPSPHPASHTAAQRRHAANGSTDSPNAPAHQCSTRSLNRLPGSCS